MSDAPTAQTVYLRLHPCEPVGQEGDVVGIRLTIEEATRVYRSLGEMIYGDTQLDYKEALIVITALAWVRDHSNLPASQKARLMRLLEKFAAIQARPALRDE